ncbi:MAG TPA: GDSL-type esterase/lipase family protein [Tepidisphaeraceae bacterium]|jgi:lysophospholipase L1-like esterase|nr:GDSL-type esterase/lipase family protein [Tepidisphaeraceae bacterium]
MHRVRALVLIITLFPYGAARAAAPPAIELKDGDNRIVFIGDGLVEQAQFSGYIETRLARRFPDRRLLCFNLGWSGDDVWGSARTAGYQNPARLERLKKEATALNPAIIFVGYGLDESFAGVDGLPHFVEGYNELLAAMEKLTPRLVLLSPPFAEDLGRPLPDEVEHNRDIERYTAAIKAIADQRHLPFVDLFHPLVEAKRANPAIRLTHNGVLLNESGYWIAAQEIEKQLGLRPEPAQLTVSADGKILSSHGIKVSAVAPENQAIRFEATAANLPAPAVPAPIAKITALMDPAPIIQAAGLAPGDWTLSIDGKASATASAAQWNSGVDITGGPDADQVEKLRTQIAERNDLYYRRWRPFNDHSRHWTYIGGDFALYDKEVAIDDQKIADLARPANHVYSLTRNAGSKP